MIFTTGINLFLKEKQTCAFAIVLDIGRILNNGKMFEMVAVNSRMGS